VRSVVTPDDFASEEDVGDGKQKTSFRSGSACRQRSDGDHKSDGRQELIFDGSKILVRSDSQNNVARLIPTADNPEIGYILNAISAEFGVTFIADQEEVGMFLAGELA
jgi:hypothetical protein